MQSGTIFHHSDGDHIKNLLSKLSKVTVNDIELRKASSKHYEHAHIYENMRKIHFGRYTLKLVYFQLQDGEHTRKKYI